MSSMYKMQSDVCCIKKQVTCERSRERATVIYFISFDIASGVCARARLFKTKTSSIVIYAAASVLLSDTGELRE